MFSEVIRRGEHKRKYTQEELNQTQKGCLSPRIKCRTEKEEDRKKHQNQMAFGLKKKSKALIIIITAKRKSL